MPILKELNFNHSLIRESYWINNEWWLSDLSFGNHLLIKDKELTKKIVKAFSNYPTVGLYKFWEKVIKELLNIK